MPRNEDCQLGTHVDAPPHFLRGGAAAEAIDLRKCIGPAAVIDVGRRSPVTEKVLAPHREAIRRTRRVLIRSGTSADVGTPSYWTTFPELSVDAADFLVELGVVLLGLDTPTPSLTDLHEVHRRLLGHGVVIAECLINLDRLPRFVDLICLPLPLVGLDGSPARVVAIHNDPMEGTHP